MRFLYTSVAILSTLVAVGQQSAARKTAEDDPAFRASVERSFREYENTLSTHCDQITPDWSRAHKTLYAKPVFDAQGKLVSALWSESVPGLACGEPRNFRAMVNLHDGSMHFFPVTPGTSNARPASDPGCSTPRENSAHGTLSARGTT